MNSRFRDAGSLAAHVGKLACRTSTNVRPRTHRLGIYAPGSYKFSLGAPAGVFTSARKPFIEMQSPWTTTAPPFEPPVFRWFGTWRSGVGRSVKTLPPSRLLCFVRQSGKPKNYRRSYGWRGLVDNMPQRNAACARGLVGPS